jgi:hypothetical protein
MRNALTLLNLFLFSFSLHSSLGEKVIPESLPKGLCLITLEKEFNRESFHCTGSYLGDGLIKTAGHCLHKSKVKYISCNGTKELFYGESTKVYPNYDHRLINREEFNRWQDHALIQLERSPKIPAFTLISTRERLEKLLPKFSECLISGYGLNEGNLTRTGVLHGSRFSPSRLKLKNQLIYLEGIYKVELMPGDSGGPLLCRLGQTWYDLGTASAHNWDHDSLYAPNFAVSQWHDDFPLNKQQLNTFSKLKSPQVQSFEIKLGETYYLLPYSQIKAEEGPFYNGDNTFTQITVTKIENKNVFGTIESLGSSSFFICEDRYLCYGVSVEGRVLRSRLRPQRFLYKN